MIVGAVIFLIITIVQFLVITKGAERIAEVSARFALDAMPGKQMTIDADFNAGLISPEEAVAKREDLQRESSLFGSMDGAMKFVKGDTIAGIIIVAINIIGGLAVGIAYGLWWLRLVMQLAIINTAAHRLGGRLFGIEIVAYDIILPLITLWLLFTKRFHKRRIYW